MGNNELDLQANNWLRLSVEQKRKSRDDEDLNAGTLHIKHSECFYAGLLNQVEKEVGEE